jgi:hypothetical protein
LLREPGHRQVSQLPGDHRSDRLRVCVVMLCDPIGMLRTVLCQGDAVLCEHASTRDGRCYRRASDDTHSAPTNSPAARHVLVKVGSARLKFVAEFLNETEKEDSMKYLLLIATLAASIATAAATPVAGDCCKGNGQCCPGKCCKK